MNFIDRMREDIQAVFDRDPAAHLPGWMLQRLGVLRYRVADSTATQGGIIQ